ncbi:MAG: hypothetical protein HOW73_00200 [Polyangiaceae bacterium]|nr:hypothetical protein [Polyangiaceae bacterium]
MSGEAKRPTQAWGNTFDDFDLDPVASSDAITERMRELVEDAEPDARQAIRSAWEELTVHPKKRILQALTTFVDPEPEVVAPPTRAPSVKAHAAPIDEPVLSLPLTELYETLGREGLLPSEPSGYVTIASDPLLKE